MPYRSVNPVTGEVLKTFTEHTDQERMDALATADKAFESWEARPFEERAKIISRALDLFENALCQYFDNLFGKSFVIAC